MEQLPSLADAPGTLREYETIYILRPDTINEKVGELNDRVKGIIEERGGKVLNVDNWGKRKLAYEVEKELKGIYLFWQYLGTPGIVSEFERNMRMVDPCIRYMTIIVGTNVESGSRESEVDGETYEKAATTAADEEEIMMGRASSEDSEEGADSSEGEAASTEAASTDAASTDAASTDAASTEAASTDAASTDAASTDAASTDAADDSAEAASTEAADDSAEAASTEAADDSADAATPDTEEEK